jgi:DNA polymerase I-like protein with 3'-5' exonuclease and polymerase domains
MLDFSSIEFILASSNEEVTRFCEGSIAGEGESVGVDVETTGLDFIGTKIAGMSMYCKKMKQAIYIPFMHEGSTQFRFCDILPSLNRLFKAKECVFHFSMFDMLRLARIGCKFFKTFDTSMVAIMLQADNKGLKPLSMEFGLAKFGELLSYKDLITMGYGLPPDKLKSLGKKEEKVFLEEYPFHKIDLVKHPAAVEYACKDAILCMELKDEILEPWKKVWEGDLPQVEEADW